MNINAVSDIGVSRRENQDNYWSAILDVDGSEVGVVCVCDGMGGLADGDLASRTIVSSVRRFFKSSVDMQKLRAQLQEDNASIVRKGKESGSSMGTTCTVLKASRGMYEILHIGDTRAYHISKDRSMRVITNDHSVIREWGITRESDPQMYAKYLNKLTRCLGVYPDAQFDFYRGSYEEGDTFLLCSDGCWHFFDNNHLDKNTINIGALINRCIEEGETDNITVCLLEV